MKPGVHSLRTKFTFTLLATAMVAIALVGVSAHWLALQRFAALSVQHSLERFAKEITEYYAAYGSWEAARAAETFFEFRDRMRPRPPPLSARVGDFARRPPRNSARGPLAGPMPPPPAHRPPPRAGLHAPIALVDQAGVVLLDLVPGYRVGESVDAALMKTAAPVTAGPAVIGLAIPMDRERLSDVEAEYLEAVWNAWLASLLAAVGLAIPIGLVLGKRFTAPIRDLTRALSDMHGGVLRQTVRVRSSDEIGELSAAFNMMSAKLATAHDELEASRARLSEQAASLVELTRRDELTNVLNRRAFDEQVETLFAQACRYDHPLTLAMIDIDHFKCVNDNFSHAVGDKVLKRVAGLIAANVRSSDIVARYGGEEFAVAFAETRLDEAARLAERLRNLVASHDWASFAPGLNVTLSIGLAQYGSDASFHAVLQQADAKLYEAKANGRNLVCRAES